MKPIVKMTDWELYVYEARYTLAGRADYHPRMGENVGIGRTSSLKNYRLEDDVLYYETRNTLYICPLKYMTLEPYKDVIKPYLKNLLKMGQKSEDALEQIVSASACMALGEKSEMEAYIRNLQELGWQELREKERIENQRLYDIIKEYDSCIYIEMENVDFGGTLAYHMEDRFGVISPTVHVGMFQDSVLYLNSEELIDFRYFPNGIGNSMETYSCSDHIEKIIIKNKTTAPLYFDEEPVGVEETRVFERKREQK